MKKILAALLYGLFSLFIVTSYVEAEITFPDGKWGTTFDCTEADVITSISCDDLSIYLNGADSAGNNSEIALSANNPLGSGNGYLQSDGYGDDGFGAGLNDSSQRIMADFRSDPHTEIWVRAYFRFPTNWSSMDGVTPVFGWDKYFWLQSAGGDAQAVLSPNSTGFRVVCQGGGTGTTLCEDGQITWKVSDMLGGSYIGDGVYHCVEFYAKMDTGTNDGVLRVWVDGTLRMEGLGVSYSKGDTPSLAGWELIAFSINQNKIIDVNGSIAQVGIDDVVIYNTSPPNRDADDNPFIGLIGATPPETSASVTSLNTGTNKVISNTGIYWTVGN